MKININSDTKELRFNPAFDVEFVAENDSYDLKNSYLSFAKIHEILKHFNTKSYYQILVISPKNYLDLVSDQSSIRTYDDTYHYQFPRTPELTFTTDFGKIFFVSSEKVENCCFLLEVEGDELKDSTITITDEDFELTKNKDFSKINLKFKSVNKVVNVGKS